jgi:hypothetical protein
VVAPAWPPAGTLAVFGALTYRDVHERWLGDRLRDTMYIPWYQATDIVKTLRPGAFTSPLFADDIALLFRCRIWLRVRQRFTAVIAVYRNSLPRRVLPQNRALSDSRWADVTPLTRQPVSGRGAAI